jgi:hypothetical protein
VRVRGYNIAELMGNVSFGAMVYLILRGELPDDATGKLMDGILCAGIDHGATPPSGAGSPHRRLHRRESQRRGRRGHHVHQSASRRGDGELREGHDGTARKGRCRRTPLNEAAPQLLAEYKDAGKRIAGFGHRFHTADPRTARLFELAEEAGAFGRHCEAAKAVEQVFADKGKPLPINVDGAIGAILADLGFEPAVMNGLFMIPRCAGMVAHVREEQTRMKPMRKVDPVAHTLRRPRRTPPVIHAEIELIIHHAPRRIHRGVFMRSA